MYWRSANRVVYGVICDLAPSERQHRERKRSEHDQVATEAQRDRIGSGA